MNVLCVFFILKLTCFPIAFAQPEVNDQFETLPTTTVTLETRRTNEINPEDNNDNKTVKTVTNEIKPLHNLIINLYRIVSIQIRKIILAPKIRSVLRNIGTCMVNGAMELISYYFPAPIIPLITSAAGMVIPFEPVMMLKHRIPVASYRRAIIMAVNTFMSTFNNYKFDYDEDPYMTRRFNRRFNKDSAEKRVL